MIANNAGNLIEILAPAKVNLFLELLARREDGFHELETVMSTVSLYDSLRISPRDDGQIRLTLDAPHDSVPEGSGNLVVVALNRLQQAAGQTRGMHVRLRKRIPDQAGLGGGSSDAAAALRAANWLWRINWPLPRLAEVAAEVGSDVTFFLTGGAAICSGRGEIVRQLNVPAGLPVVIAKPPAGLATADVYQNCQVPARPRSSQGLIRGLKTGRPLPVARQLWNRLEASAADLTGAIVRLKHEFSRTACLGHQLSGSGTSYFGIFSNYTVAKIEARRLSNRLPDVRIFCSQTLNRSPGAPAALAG